MRPKAFAAGRGTPRRSPRHDRTPTNDYVSHVTNNDVLRGLRYALEMDNPSLVECFALGGIDASLADVASILKREEERGYEPLADEDLQSFLDGFVKKHRGQRETTGPETTAPLTNNRVLRALRIALQLKDTDMLAIVERSGMALSKAELNAFFRREDHRNYQACGNQVLRNFLKGLGLWHRAGRPLT